MKNNRGFIAISVIYSFVVVFLMIMLIVLNSYFNNRVSFNMYKDNIKVKAALGYNYEGDSSLTLVDELKKQVDLTSTSSSGIKLDGSTYGSYRYFGSAPNNYVCFGKYSGSCTEEKYLFRIIGLFKESNVTTAGGGGFVTKVVRAKPLGVTKPYDASSNTWGTSSLKNYLNTEYLTDPIASGFEDMFNNQLMVEAKWYAPQLTTVAITPKDAYTKEMTAANSYITNAKVGLLSVSDWGYASRYTGKCKENTTMDKYNSGLDYTCYMYNWLNNFMWFIDSSSTAGKGFTLSNGGSKYNLALDNVTVQKRIYPSFYINSKAVVIAGSGTKVDPYIISLPEA